MNIPTTPGVLLAALLVASSPARAEEAPPPEEGTPPAEEAEPAPPEADPEPTPAPTPVAVSAPRPAALDSASVQILVTADNHGGLVDSPCGGAGEAPPLLARVGRALAAAKQGRPATFLFDAGGGLFPSPLVIEAAADPGNAAAIARLLSRSGYDAMAVSEALLAAPNPAARGILHASREARVPMVSSSLTCADDAAAGCMDGAAGLVAPTALVERAGVSVGFASVLPAAAADRMRAEIRAGARVTAPVDAARAAVRQLRSEGADVVVLVSHLDDSSTAPRATLDLLAALEGADRPDLVVAAGASSAIEQLRAPGGGAPILAVPPGLVGRVVLARSAEGWAVDAVGVHEPPVEGDADVADPIRASHRAYCEANGTPLARGTLAAPLDRDGFTRLVLRTMREAARAEVAFIDAAAVSPHALFPYSGQLTREEIARALPNDTELRVAWVRGSDLTTLAGKVLDSGRAVAAGVVRVDGALKVNGRDINPDGSYRVVTTAHVASGGGGVIPPDAARWRPLDAGEGGALEIEDRVVQWLATGRDETPYDPSSDLDLYRRPLWYGTLTLDAGISDASIWNSAGYDQAQLARPRVFDVRGELHLRAGFSTRDHSWDNDLTLRYGRQRLESEPGSDSFTWGESADLVSYRSAYSLDYIRNALLEGAWYGPSVFLEYRLESEFYHERVDAEDDSAHFLEMTGLLGLKLQPLSWLLFQAAGGVRSVLLVPEPYPLPGLGLRAEIIRHQFYEPLPLYLAAAADYFVGWPVAVPDDGVGLPSEGSTVHKFSLEGRLEFQIYGPLALTASARLFLYDEDTGPLALSVDSMLGLRVVLAGHTQDF